MTSTISILDLEGGLLLHTEAGVGIDGIRHLGPWGFPAQEAKGERQTDEGGFGEVWAVAPGLSRPPTKSQVSGKHKPKWALPHGKQMHGSKAQHKCSAIPPRAGS